MFDEQKVEAILQGIAALNTKLGVFAYLIPAVFTLVVIYLYYQCTQNPGRKTSARLMNALGVVYLYAGLTILAGIQVMGASLAIAGAVALWLIALLLFLDARFFWTEVRTPNNPDLKVISLLLMVTGIFLYPLVEIALGFIMPRMVLFGAECPTTIFLIGLLIGAIPKTNKPLLVIASINALIVGFSIATHGAPFDYLYGLAGLLGVLMTIKYYRDIFERKASPSQES